jgi:hypothetical protein
MNIASLRRSWLAPLFFFQIYLSLTVFIFFFGPWPWEINNPSELFAFLLAAQISIFLGYFMAWPKIKKLNRHHLYYKSISVINGLHFNRHAVIITLLMFIPTSLSRTGGIIPDVVAGIVNTGAVYNENLSRLEAGNPFVVVEYLRMMLAPWLIALFPLTVVYWGRMSLMMRLACVIANLANLTIFIATGINKGLADFVIVTPWLIYLGVVTGALRIDISKTKLALLFGVLFFLFLQFFANSQLQRSGSVGEFGVLNTGNGVIQADSSAFIGLLSDNYRVIYESLTRYLVQGYYALSLSFQVDNNWTFGFGNSMFLARNANIIFDTSYFSQQSLPGLVEAKFGWSMMTLWHSIYPWLASDFGYIGSIFAIGVFSYLLSLSWGMSLCTLHYRWVTMVFLMLVLFFYIPANNQIFQTGETCVGFFLILITLMLPINKRFIYFKSIKRIIS